MNNIEDENGVIGSHLKIIRDSIGGYSWDSSSHDINSGYGVNEWSTSAIAKVLNENFYNKKVGGKCYNTQDLRETKCPDWESIGLNDEARSMVSKVKWNTGTMPVKYDENNNSNLITPTYMYNAEKSKNIGNICNNETYCNDKVKRTTLWTGYVGLMYPSDYGYATNGGGESQRQDCLNISMSSWHLENNKTNCVDNNWLKLQDGFQWTITPATSSTYSCESFALRYEGCMGVGTVRSGNGVKPVVYLNSNVKIEPNDDINYGSIDKPFKLINE